ncbi:hypothetical protein EUTSA_v10027032mg [Eutrema salsugineum]|uniref:Uncharacterized protein n=1 Tax=Eutrema salsugineum TaxID=72664 RepID=V4MGJ0_EUTSA|nr:defensin-like protein 306 [Eutrema salsugineum]ESQ55649.1 hypothetical protein EUTSA_v10027032mg [Eutrema salsugineum]
MKKAALIFMGLVLFSTCTQIMAQTCEQDSDCSHMSCVTKIKCQDNECICVNDKHVVLPLDTNCGVHACIDFCKAKGEQAYACLLNHCYCRKPPM